MAITDYLSGINNATSGEKTDVNTATADLSALQTGAGSLPAKLKEALNLKLNNNKDIIDQQSATMENYFNSGANARQKYQDVWNPFEKAKLVQQDRSMALRPYDTLSGVLENRMGTVADTVTAGVSGWQGMVEAGKTKLDTAKSMLSTALSSYLSAADQQTAADDMAYKVEAAKEASRQFEKNYGLEETKVNNQVSQFDKQMALEREKLRLSGIGSSGGGSGPGGTYTESDVGGLADMLVSNSIIYDPETGAITGFRPILPDDVNKIANGKNENVISSTAMKRLSETKKAWEDSKKTTSSGGYFNMGGTGFSNTVNSVNEGLFKPLFGTPGGDNLNPIIDYFFNRK